MEFNRLRFKLMVVLIALASWLAPLEQANGSTTLRTKALKSCLKMRKSSAKNSKVVGCIPGRESVRPTGKRQGGKIQVSYGGRKGWVPASYLVKGSAVKRSARPVASVTDEPEVRDEVEIEPASFDGQVQEEVAPGGNGLEYQTDAGLAVASLKRDPKAAKGICLLDVIDTDAKADEVLRDYRVKPVKATRKERHAIAKVLFQVSAFFGDVFKPLKNMTIKFNSPNGRSRQTKTGLQMRRGAHNCNSAHFAHEMGHTLGNSAFPGSPDMKKGGNYYEAYRKAMRGTKCQPTSYSKSKSNENFAEVFATFVARPDVLKSKKYPGCKKAFAFFSQQVFPKAGKFASCKPEKKKYLLDYLFARPASKSHGIVLGRRGSSGGDGSGSAAGIN